MIKFLKITMSILIISSLFTACAKKPEYYQTVYNQQKSQNSKISNGNHTNVSKLEKQPVKNPTSIPRGYKEGPDIIEVILTLPFTIPLIAIMVASNYVIP